MLGGRGQSRNPKYNPRQKNSKAIGNHIQETHLTTWDTPLNNLQKDCVEKGKTSSLSVGLKMKKGLFGVGEGPEGKDRQKKEIEEVEDFIARLHYDRWDFLRRKGEGDEK